MVGVTEKLKEEAARAAAIERAKVAAARPEAAIPNVSIMSLIIPSHRWRRTAALRGVAPVRRR
jgi:hypothetical protein